MKFALVLLSIGPVWSTRLQSRGRWLCPEEASTCHCECPRTAGAGGLFTQLEAKPAQVEVEEVLPPRPPPPLPPMPPGKLPPMPSYTKMTEDDLPTLGPPPATTTLSTTLPLPAGHFPAMMMNGRLVPATDEEEHYYQYFPGARPLKLAPRRCQTRKITTC